MTRRPNKPAWPARLRQSFLLITLLTQVIACRGEDRKPGEKSRKPIPRVLTTTVEEKALTERLELTGSIEPSRIARMASPIEGPVIFCQVREGDRVRAGQILARLGRTQGDDAVAASARVELDREEQELGRIEKLVKTGAIPGEELDKARVKVSEAQAAMARASERLGDYRISAPWAGIVSKVHVTVGDFISARSPLVELFDAESLVLRFAIPETSAARVTPGAAIRLTLDAHPDKNLSAEVTRIYPDIDREIRSRTVEAELKTEASLAPGMFARLQLTLASEPKALAIPAEAILRKNDQAVVFVITEEDKAVLRTVRTGIEDGGQIQILEGVQQGERIAIAGHTQLRPDMKVKPLRPKMKAKPASGKNAQNTRTQGPVNNR